MVSDILSKMNCSVLESANWIFLTIPVSVTRMSNTLESETLTSLRLASLHLLNFGMDTTATRLVKSDKSLTACFAKSPASIILLRSNDWIISLSRDDMVDASIMESTYRR